MSSTGIQASPNSPKDAPSGSSSSKSGSINQFSQPCVQPPQDRTQCRDFPPIHRLFTYSLVSLSSSIFHHTCSINSLPRASNHRMSFFGGPPSHRSSTSRASYSRPKTTFPRAPSSTASFFSRNGGSSSYYKRRPRDGYIQSLIYKLKRLIRDLWDYAQRHPFKAFMAVVVPLISAGGALHGLLKQFGIKIPFGLEGMFATGGGYYGTSRYDAYDGYGNGSVFGGSSMATVGSMMKVARAFM
jgi:hypothetical protein